MLGRPVAVYGDVVAGDGRGRTIGIPTANLDLHHELHPPPGVYACRARIVSREGEGEDAGEGEDTERRLAVANVGTRPTFAGKDGRMPALPLVEVHLLDYSGDLYGRHLELEFLAFLREERRFGGVDALKTAIAADIERARTVAR
jgi:riboflavin kinase/FMN adenylyltransferase